MVRVGILALQGNFADHERVLGVLGVETRRVRRGSDLKEIDGLIIPGGESTVMRKLLREYDLEERLIEFAHSGKPIMGTCAGAILIGRVPGGEEGLGLVDVTIERNSYGRQVESFVTPLSIPQLGENVLEGMFIRAPRILNSGPGIETLATLGENPVLVRQDREDGVRALLATFHPELTDDRRIHVLFLDMIR